MEVHVSYVLQQCSGTGPGKMNNKVVKCLCNLCTDCTVHSVNIAYACTILKNQPFNIFIICIP